MNKLQTVGKKPTPKISPAKTAEEVAIENKKIENLINEFRNNITK
jgi:hypothetical protein